MEKVVLGVDTSTQSCTIVARRIEDGSIVQTVKAAHPVTHPPVSEQHPDEWWSAFKKCLSQLDNFCLLYTSPSPRDGLLSRMPSSA